MDVHLLLNGTRIASTRAAQPAEREDPGGDVRRFRFITRDLPRYVGPRDRITVRTRGTALPIKGAGTRFRPKVQGQFNSGELLRQLENGYVLSRVGHLQASRKDNVEWQRDVTRIATALADDVSRLFGHDIFYTYGSMLGAVRERGFLGFDVDLDMGYLSTHTAGSRVGPELRDIALGLIAEGWMVEPFRTHLHVLGEHDGRIERVDLFPHYFDKQGILRFPYGMAGTHYVRTEEWKGVHQVAFETWKAPVPVAAEGMLAQLYGDSWREPQPGFHWPRDRTERADAGLMSPADRDEVYWTDFHRRVVLTEPSPFFSAISSRLDCPRVVVDLGCGEGRDTMGFAATGRRVVAIDRSTAALTRLRARLTEADEDTRALVDVRAVDVFSDDLDAALADAVTAAGDEPLLFYLRFLLHAWSPESEAPFLDALRRHARPGDVFAAEFRDQRDKKLPKTHPYAPRVLRDGVELAQRLRFEYGLTVLEEDRGTGRSPYGIEDPDLFRIVGRYGAAITSGR